MSYRIEPKDKYFRVFCVLPEKEIQAKVSVTFSALVDLTEIQALREEAKRKGGIRPSYTAFIVKAIAMGMREYPYVNRRVFRQPWRPFLGPRLQTFEDIDVSVAVERHLQGKESLAFVDILRDADRKSLATITEWLRVLAASDETNNEQWRTFNQVIRRNPWWLAAFIARLPVWMPDLWQRYRGGAAMVTSPAKYGVERLAASWAWPLGVSFGFVAPRPMAVDGEAVVRPSFDFVINFDRRVMAGAQAATFFAHCVDSLTHAATKLDLPDEDPSAE